MVVVTRSGRVALLLVALLTAVGLISWCRPSASLLQPREPSGEVLITRGDQPSESWTAAVDKGKEVLSLLTSDSDCIEQSPWTDESVLGTYGWRAMKPEPVTPGQLGQAFTTMFKEWKLPERNKSKTKMAYVHDKDPSPPAVKGGKVYQPTRARYLNIFGPGVIVRDNNHSPAFEGGKMQPAIKGEDVVPLQRWSDLVFLQWKTFSKDDGKAIQGLRFVVSKDVTTPETLSVLKQVLERHQKGLKIQGVDPKMKLHFDIGTQEAQAVLSTPHGKGLVWLLAQHKAQLGEKTVKAMWVFNGAPTQAGKFNLAFELVDVPAQQKAVAERETPE